MGFIDLHVHTEYTKGNGISNIPDLVKRAKEFGMNALAITDSGSIKGFDKFKSECIKNDIKPIFGCGFYFAPLGLENPETHHLLLLAKGSVGYSNIDKLSQYPRVDFELISKYSEDVYCLTGGRGGVIDKPYLQDNPQLALNNLNKLIDIYGGRLRLELQENGLTHVIKKLSDKYSIPMIVTGGSFYINRADASRCNSLRRSNGNRELKGDSYYFKSEDNIRTLFKEFSSAVDESVFLGNIL